jgi:hypothetical protein
VDDRVTGRRLAAAGLSHQAKRFPSFQAEADPVDRFHHPGASETEVMRLQIFNV